jgi:hypothetical protein
MNTHFESMDFDLPHVAEALWNDAEFEASTHDWEAEEFYDDTHFDE